MRKKSEVLVEFASGKRASSLASILIFMKFMPKKIRKEVKFTMKISTIQANERIQNPAGIQGAVNVAVAVS